MLLSLERANAQALLFTRLIATFLRRFLLSFDPSQLAMRPQKEQKDFKKKNVKHAKVLLFHDNISQNVEFLEVALTTMLNILYINNPSFNMKNSIFLHIFSSIYLTRYYNKQLIIRHKIFHYNTPGKPRAPKPGYITRKIYRHREETQVPSRCKIEYIEKKNSPQSDNRPTFSSSNEHTQTILLTFANLH